MTKMEKRIIIWLIFCAVVGFGTLFFIDISEYKINLHSSDITDTHHTYKMYSNTIDMLLNQNAIAECRLEVMSNGNYYNDPSPLEFAQWMNSCKYHKERFTPTYFKYR